MFTYIRDKKNNITSNFKRINVVLSYIQGDHVNAWVQNYTDQNFNESREEWRVSWAQFKEHLKEQFIDSNLARDAQDQIERLHQGQDTAKDFFQKFKILITQAGYLKDDAYVVRLLKTNVNKKIINQIYGSQNGLPEEYREWKKQIIQINQLWRRRMASKRPGMQFRPQASQAATLRANYTNPPMLLITPQDATSVTYGGTGKPMDINNTQWRGLCFSCSK